MEYSAIVNNQHFRNIAAMLRAGRSHQIARAPFNLLARTPYSSASDEWLGHFVSIQMMLTRSGEATISTDDMDWFVSLLDGERPDTIIALLLAYASAPEEPEAAYAE